MNTRRFQVAPALAGLLLLAVLSGGPALAAGQVLRDDDNFKISAEILPGPSPGQGRLALTLEPEGAWKITLEAPLKVDLAPPAGLKLARTALTKSDLVVKTKERARFEVACEAAPASRHKLKLRFDFVLCDDKLCQKKKLDLEHVLSIP